ncbi:complement C1q subcomponent subunit B-like, partial [Mytilus edulis]|uniref:complement C1q subcomponent subunit B-like n=1 Tax=Mytilus edulis TaxID=6550 RepID=UPI0039EF7526
NAVVKDLLTMLVKYKGSDFINTRNWRYITAITASLSSIKTINAKEILKFDKVWTNNGNHYDPNTGIFQAPREGLYHNIYYSSVSKRKNSLCSYMAERDQDSWNVS